ncbi:helix-turn-helix domain-containing protein [Candidatus Omnitrophota bacterium]
MTIKETCVYLKKSTTALYKDMKRGIIPTVKIGNKRLIVKDVLDRQIMRQLKYGRRVS